MRLVLIIVGALLLNSGCIQTPREQLKDTVCSLSCENSIPKGWQGGRFSKISPSKANVFIDRMFYGFIKELREDFKVSDMADKLSKGLARGFYAKSDDKEIFLYVELEAKVFEKEGRDPYYYYPYVRVLQAKINEEMSRASSGCIDESELLDAGVEPELLHLTFPEEYLEFD